MISTAAVVIGSGCAGLNAVDCLMRLGVDCLLVTEDMNAGTSRNTGSDKQTYYKLSLAGDEPDSVGDLARTLCGPDMHGDIALCEAALSAQSFLKLCALGVPFPTNEYGEYVGYQTDHDTRRRATSAGPLTSRMMTEALEGAVRARNARVLDHALAARIVTDEAGVAAVDVWLRDMQELRRIRCGSVAVYENTRVLPLGYMVSPEILSWNYTVSSPFAVQNDFIAKATGERISVFHDMVPVSIDEEGVTVANPGTNSFSY